MDDIVLVNKNGQEIKSIEELMLYVLDYFSDSLSDTTGDTETDFYNLLEVEDILDVDEEDFEIETLSEGLSLLKKIEPNYWHIAR